MLKHVVCFKFHSHVDDTAVKDFEAALDALPAAIAEIESYEFGRDVIHGERSYDFALIATFGDRAALQRYQTHPDHVAVLAKVKDMCAAVIAVDFEY